MKKILSALFLLAFCSGQPNAQNNTDKPISKIAKSATAQQTVYKQLSNIPAVFIETENTEDITSKDYYLNGRITIVSDNGATVFTDTMEVKGRGNYSWNSTPKKPYRVKLNHKANLLGMPAKAKNWTLLNNYGDKTLMRNLLAFDFSRRLEIPFSPSGKNVDLILNGKYRGCYQLCDQIEVNPGRVEVEKMDDDDIKGDSLTGGYLVEIDAYASQEAKYFDAFWRTGRRGNNMTMPVTIKYPDSEDITYEQENYIVAHFNAMASAIQASSGNIKNYIDVETFVRHFLVGEFSGNTDTYWSTNMYKKRNDDKFYFGPVWDFDLGYENDNRTYPINSNTEWIYASSGSVASSAVREFVTLLVDDPAVYKILKGVWAKYRLNGAISKHGLLKVVDDYAAELNASQELNFDVWDIMNVAVHQNPGIWGSYEAEVDNVKDYISDRITWIDYKLNFDASAVGQTKASDILHWLDGKTIHIKGLSNNSKLELFDLTGRMIQTQTCSESTSINLEQGSYLIRITDQLAGIKSIKCLVP